MRALNPEKGKLYKIEWEDTEEEDEPYPKYNTLYKSPNKVRLMDRALTAGTPVIYLERGKTSKGGEDRWCLRWHKVVYGELIGWIYCHLSEVIT